MVDGRCDDNPNSGSQDQNAHGTTSMRFSPLSYFLLVSFVTEAVHG
jgi:hypothetical protein